MANTGKTRSVRTRLAILSLLILTPGWDGPSRLELLGRTPRITATRVALDPADPARNTVGRLTYMGGVMLTSPDPVFGGFSSMRLEGERFTLLSDGGNIVRFRLDDHWRLTAPEFAELPDGPRSGWEKRDRDSESMTSASNDGDVLVGFEYANEIWRYDARMTRAIRHAAPPAMARWPENRGAEAMVRTADGGTIVLAETAKPRRRSDGRVALYFTGDPTSRPNGGFRFVYVPPAGYDPSDAALLPDGRILVLNRHYSVPLTFAAKLTIVDPRAIRPHAIVRGEDIATLAAPLIHDNLEGLTVKREGDATVIWIVSDDNQFPLERTLLLKFRLDAAATSLRQKRHRPAPRQETRAE